MTRSITRPSYDHLFKMIIIGDSSVGKTSMLLRFAEEYFPTTHMPTIGIDFKIKIINVDKKRVKLQIWDTAGQERFRNITQTYYKGAAAIILMFDCTDRRSFTNVSSWMKQIDTHASKDVIKVIVANKTDLDDRDVSSMEGRDLAVEYGCDYFETSAKTGEGVNEVFFEKASAALCSNEVLRKKLDKKRGDVDLRKTITGSGCESGRARKTRWCKWF